MNRRRERNGEAPPRAATSANVPRWRERLGIAFDQHLYSALSSLGRLWARRTATTLTVLVMGLALALPLLLLLALQNVQRFGGTLTDSRELSVFMTPEADRARADTLARAADALPDAAATVVRTPGDGLQDLRQLAGFAQAVDLLTDNPLPHVIVVTPDADADAARVTALAEALRVLPDVDFVQYDLTWRERLTRALDLAARVVLLVAVLLSLGALLVVGNTIRLDVSARAEEIAIVQLLGGTDGFVRRPFLYAGMWYGGLAATVALIAVLAAQILLGGSVTALAQSYGSEFRLHGLSGATVATTLAVGLMLGWLGAWFACGRQLARARPR